MNIAATQDLDLLREALEILQRDPVLWGKNQVIREIEDRIISNVDGSEELRALMASGKARGGRYE